MSAKESTVAAPKPNVFDDFDPEVRVRTKKMLMYFIIFAIVMLFAGITSAYLLSNTGTYWVHINPPAALTWSIASVVISSATMIVATRAMKNGNKQLSLIMMIATFTFGILFTATQLEGWADLKSKGMGWTDVETDAGIATSWNNIEKITGEYGIDADYYVYQDGLILDYQNGDFYAPSDPLKEQPITRQVLANTNNSGAFIWVLIWVHIIHLAFGLIYLVINIIRIISDKITPGDNVRLHTNGLYWHFMGILWVYLFVFLFIIH